MRASLRNAVALVAALGCAAIAADQLRARSQSHYLATQRYEDVYYLPPIAYLEAGSLGYREALADLIWLKALVYFGEELAHRGGVVNVYRYTDAMLALDPYFKQVYLWIGSVAIYRTGEITSADVRKAIAYLERGARLFPDDGELAWSVGATYDYELVPMLKDPAEREDARRHGLPYLELAVERGAGPAWLVLETAGKLDQLGRAEQAIRHLQDVYATVSDPVVKQQIEQSIAHLTNATYVEAMRRTAAELEATRQRDFPYVDAGLFMLLGKRPAFDGNALLLRNFDPLDARRQIDDAD